MSYGYREEPPGTSTTSPWGWAIGIVVGIIVLFAVIAGLAWAFSFKGVDPGHVAIIKEGGPFDGRSLTEVRQPGAGPKAIGAFNHQYSLPTTARDLTEEAGSLVVPTADGVNVVVDGQALFQLKVDATSDMQKNLDAKFFRNFGLRKWDGANLWDDDGWAAFLHTRMVPILYQSVRQTIGSYECTQLNNTCVYVLNADVLKAKVGEQAKKANVEQNLSQAEQSITVSFRNNLNAGLGDDYFENVRFQNLRVTFPKDIQDRVQEAQGKRAEVATAKLEAQRVKAQAIGEKQANIQKAIGLQRYSKALRQPGVADVEKIKALCGVDEKGNPLGCQNLQVLGGGSIITNLGGQK